MCTSFYWLYAIQINVSAMYSDFHCNLANSREMQIVRIH
jgi:hypothetical protein